MKLAFFLTAFCLILFRVYYGSLWPGHGERNPVTITISNGDDYEKIKYSGAIILTEDEAGIASMASGGYIRYRRNDIRLDAESDLQGNIRYVIRDGDHRLAPDGDGKKVIGQAVSEMIAYGFDARGRMLRVYKKGGDTALLRAMVLLKSPGLAETYRKFLVSHGK